jgi:hypothetical protein
VLRRNTKHFLTFDALRCCSLLLYCIDASREVGEAAVAWNRMRLARRIACVITGTLRTSDRR